MKFGQNLQEHIRRCEAKSPPCSGEDYVDYKSLKQRIKNGCTQSDFQENYGLELSKVSSRLSEGSVLSRDPHYAVMNRQALDKISKKFDKQLKGRVRAANWVTTTSELAKSLGGLQVEDAFIPPDLRPANGNHPPALRSAALRSGCIIFFAGGFSGIMSRTLTAPLDRIKIMMQAGNAPNLKGHQASLRWDSSSGKLRGAARAILRDGGLRAFWQGNGANVLKVMPESAVKFLVYDKVKDALGTTAGCSTRSVSLPVSERLLAGSVAGCVSQLVVYPLDVIKTRLAAAPAGAYNGIFDCIQVTVWKEGIQALYKGLWPALLAIIPASGIDLAVYHTLKVHYTERFRKEETSNMPLALSLCFGAASATCGALVAYPLTVVRTRLIVQGMPGRPMRYRGVFDCFWKILDAHGPTGFYRGLIPALCKTIPAMSIGWAAFEFAKSLAEVNIGPLSPEYKIYIDTLLKPLLPETLRIAAATLGGRGALERALTQFIDHLRPYVPGCDDRKLSRACVRRAKGIEQQLQRIGETLLADPLREEVLKPEDMHGIWHGFVAMRGWRDCRVPQECLLTFLSGILNELDDDILEEWKDQALKVELPKVQHSVSVAAWPGLCQHLGELPACVTAQELREALWQQAFVENPTRAPDHRNYRRFALLAAQMVAIGVELETQQVELLVRQVLNLDRPWRERRDMLSGILSAASVADRQQVVEKLDQRFDAHAEIDDFEIVCGIAEHIGIEIPPGGAIRRCALRRWALDTKRGGALPVARLMDFVDNDITIGQDVAQSLRQRGRIADAALLLSRLPKQDRHLEGSEHFTSAYGDVELERLQDILSLGDDGAFYNGEDSEFGPVDSGGFVLPDFGFRGAAATAAA
ncbi:Calcium-binding mitochondrial carrier protein SCaMC-2-A (Small calcium-binding mitochondrial carrier protein 2-A) (Solute carrier family 25 member 25-A), partial [Durusdinium trenchii]